MACSSDQKKTEFRQKTLAVSNGEEQARLELVEDPSYRIRGDIGELGKPFRRKRRP